MLATLIMYFCAVIDALLVAMTKNYYCMTCRVIGKMIDRLTSAVVVVVTSSTPILADLTKGHCLHPALLMQTPIFSISHVV